MISFLFLFLSFIKSIETLSSSSDLMTFFDLNVFLVRLLFNKEEKESGVRMRSVAFAKTSRTSSSFLGLRSLFQFLHVVTTPDGIEES